MTTQLEIQRFHVLCELGSGGMGRVYRALDPQLLREVAIKVLANPAASAAKRLSLHDTVNLQISTCSSGGELLSEARMMARMSHPNVLPVYEIGLANGALFVVMEHIGGWDLARWLIVPRTVDDILRVLAQAGRGLAAAHSRGIVHRDFKPANVLVGKDGRVRVADFGLSQLVSTDATRATLTEYAAGTPGYIAPELLLGRPATTASDVFSFAVVVAEALGVAPGTPAEARERRLRERGAPARLRAALTACLAEPATERCSLDALIATLEPRRRQPNQWLFASAVVAVAVAGVSIAAPAARASKPAPVCDLGVADRNPWQLVRRTELLLGLARAGGDAESIQRIVAIFDRKDRAIGDAADETCRAEHAGELTHLQASVRRTCFARRRVELTSVAERTLAKRDSLDRVSAHALQIADAEPCLEVEPAAGREQPHLIPALYKRWVATWDVESTDREVALLERLASRHRDRELAVRIGLDLARRMIAREQFDAAEAAAQRAYRGAMEIRDSELAASALVERSRLASLGGDGPSAESFAQLAKELGHRSRTHAIADAIGGGSWRDAPPPH